MEDVTNSNKRKTVKAKPKRTMYKDMEAELVKIIKTMRENGGIVSVLYIKIKALKYMQYNHPRTSFKASDGWLRNFNNRNGFTLRRVTTTGREMPEDTLEILKKHLDECEQLLTGIDQNQLINMLKENEILHDYIDDQHPSDEIDGFGVDDPTVFEKEISNQEANLIRMDNEIEAVESDDAEDSDFQTDSNSELEEEDDEEDDEVDDEEDNQEEENNHPTTSASANELEKKRKRKEYKTKAYNKLLSAANNQDRPISITTAKKAAAKNDSKTTPNAKIQKKTAEKTDSKTTANAKPQRKSASKENIAPAVRKQPSRVVKKS